tara:strand:- start:769 stop:1620 length:852 start_codon:yes stop_codon:yes gene_type:complete
MSMSGDESDESISTEEMNQNIEEKKSSVERIKPKRKMSEKQLQNLQKGREKRAANKKAKEEDKTEINTETKTETKTEIKPKVKKVKKTQAEPLVQELDSVVNEIIEPVVEPVVEAKKTRGRPKKPESEKGKVIERTIVKEFHYLAPIGENGAYEKVSVKKITPKNAHIHENIQKSNQMMEDDNTNYRLKKNGQVDKRSSNRGEKKLRTEKQIAAAKLLGQRTKEKYAKLKEEKDAKLKATIQDGIVDCISMPISKVKEKQMAERKTLEEKQKEQLLKNKSLFS